MSAPRTCDRAAGWTIATRRGKPCAKPDGFPTTRRHRCAHGAPEEGDWVLTEENIIGKPADLLFTKRLHPHAGKRLETLRALFPQARFELCFSIRSRDGFCPSLYSEVVRNHGFVPFEKFHDPPEFARHSRVDAVDAMAAHLPEENIVSWRFEDFRAVLPQALEAITGDPDARD